MGFQRALITTTFIRLDNKIGTSYSGNAWNAFTKGSDGQDKRYDNVQDDYDKTTQRPLCCSGTNWNTNYAKLAVAIHDVSEISGMQIDHNSPRIAVISDAAKGEDINYKVV